MQDLWIGQVVSFDHIAESIYEGDDKKVVFTEVHPMMGVIVGIACKQEGTYSKGSSGGWWNDGEIDPPSFSVSKVIQLWEVRTGWRNRPVLVSDDHAKPTDEVFKLPTQSLKPQRIILPEYQA